MPLNIYSYELESKMTELISLSSQSCKFYGQSFIFKVILL